jgi:hypothetical protein
MTGAAVIEVIGVGRHVLFLSYRHVVLMASIAGVGCVGIDVARFTGNRSIALVCDVEGVLCELGG